MQRIFDRVGSSHLFYVPIMLAYYTGMRLGECLGLEWKNIDLDGKIIKVESTLYDKNKSTKITKSKTKNSIREIDFTDKLFTILKTQKNVKLKIN